MAHTEQAIVTRLGSSTALTALLGSTSAIYYNSLPQSPTYPVVFFVSVFRDRTHLSGRDSPLIRTRYQIDCLGEAANGPAVILNIAEQVRFRLQRWSSTEDPQIQDCLFKNEMSSFEEGSLLHSQRLEVDVWSEETTG